MQSKNLKLTFIVPQLDFTVVSLEPASVDLIDTLSENRYGASNKTYS